VEAGADYWAFNFYLPSVRATPQAECMQLMVKLQVALQDHRQHVRMVGVFVNATPQEARTIRDDCNLDLMQLSGDETPEVAAAFGQRASSCAAPKVRRGSGAGYPGLPSAQIAPPAWLIDAYRSGEYGGTGRAADWSLARLVSASAPILLAGGLNPGNVAMRSARYSHGAWMLPRGSSRSRGSKMPAESDRFYPGSAQRPARYCR
jgi:phosphoribosylanthranilate isomerase